MSLPTPGRTGRRSPGSRRARSQRGPDELTAPPPRRASRPNVVRWLAGYLTSLTGTEAFYVALSWSAVRLTSPTGAALVLLANAVPRAVLLLVAGVLADRVGPKAVVVAADAGRALVMLGFGVLLLLTPPTLPVLVAVAVLVGVAEGFFLPAAGAMAPRLVPAEALVGVQAARTITIRASLFIGAPLGGWLVARGSVGAAFLANAALFVLAVAALASTRLLADPDDQSRGADGPGRPHWSRALLDGLREVVSRPSLRNLMVVLTLLELGFTGPFTVGMPLLANNRSWGATGVGWLIAAFGVGAALTAGVLVPTRSALLRNGPAMAAALIAMGLGLAGVGLAATAGLGLVVACAAGVVCGAGAGIFGTLANTAAVTQAPAGHVARVMSVVSLVSFTSLPVSVALTGVVTQVSDPTTPFLIGGSMLAVAGLLTLSTPSLRSLRLT